MNTVKPIIDEHYINKYGPIYWELIHLEAFKLNIDELYNENINDLNKRRNEFINMFEYIVKNMMCSCRNHAYQILMKNSHLQYKYIFQYTVDFHNEVNIRLNKPIFSYYNALIKYKEILSN